MKLARPALLLLIAWASTAMGQAYPNKPVHIIVPFTAGSATDILARTFGQKLSEIWNQSVIVDNRPGAGGTIGAAVVAKAAPDGYTLLVHSAAQAYNPSIYPSLPYDTVKDFVDIAPLGGQPNVLVVAPAAGLKTVAELIAQAKQKPGQLNFASAGTGSGTHINGEKFKLAAGIDVVHIPYKGTPEALSDTLAGRVSYFFSPISAALSFVRDGKLLALAVSTARRSSVLPNVPTIAESGLPGFDYSLWVGMFAPAGTPTAIVDRIARDLRAAEQASDVKERLAALGAEPMPMTPAEFTQFVNSEIVDSAKIVKAAGIKVQ
ncbi:MAG TPA: tripartite tricarboxylate transporter substrate binding protein [Casimicrobiaceae bacterium]|jgi:tripartite-type tricarboxylate transporter receptor subunit TctC|nr:tripartite tricarboxylate transporter substrate binding protein [Casimicrobiaceae bacterium]